MSAPAYAAGYLITRVIPRSRNRWVFASDIGVTGGALALLDYVRRHAKRDVRGCAQTDARGRARGHAEGVKPLWLAASPDEAAQARRHGVRAVEKNTLAGFWATARARVVVVTHGFGDANRYGVFGAFVVQLWHGTPLKLLHLDSPATLRVAALERFAIVVRLLRSSYRRAGRNIGLFIAASETAAARFKSGFALADEQVAVTGDPRMDRLADGASHDGAQTTLLKYLGVDRAPSGGFIMYAPTWRDGAANPKTIGSAERARLHEYLERRDAVLIVRSHRLGGEPDFEEAGGRIAFLPESVVPDVLEVLVSIDVLVTDYSAIAFDFAVTKRPIVFFAPDLAGYTKSRGLYEDYGRFTEGDYATDWASTIDRLEALGDDSVREWAVERTKRLCARFQAFDDGQNTARVYQAIIRRLAGQ